jgi:ribonuclease R
MRYAHFTSPIRRYADLLVHRSLIKAYDLGEGALSDVEAVRLEEISGHISTTERNSALAERNSVDRFTAAFLLDKIGAEFSGRISGVTRFGLFIKLDQTGADGSGSLFVPCHKITTSTMNPSTPSSGDGRDACSGLGLRF